MTNTFSRVGTSEAGGSWPPAMQGYATLFEQKFDAFYARADPKHGASVTMAHGDFRGRSERRDRLSCFRLLLTGPAVHWLRLTASFAV